MPVRLAVTGGTVADCSLALPLIEGIEAECLLADKAYDTKAYDTNEIIAAARESGMNPVIPPKSNRREKRDYDRALYKLRHLVENGFLEFKQWRGVATRYAKRTASYLAACQLRAVMIWSKLF
jgi:transposase